MDSRPRWYGLADAWFKLLAAIAIGYIILAQAIALVRDLADVSVILIGGIFVAYFVFPMVSWLNKRLPLWAALSIVYVGFAVLLLLGLYFVVPTLVQQFQSLVADLPMMQRTITNFLTNPSNPLLAHLPPGMQQYVQKLPTQFVAELQRNAAVYTSRVVNALLLISAVAAVAVAIPVVSIYMLAESPMIKRFFVRAFRPQWRQEVVDFLGDVDTVIGGFIRGQVIVAATVGGLAIVALVLLHVPYAFVVGAWAGIADIIPYIGPFAGAIPAAIIAIINNGIGSLAGVVVAFVIINQLEGHLLGPRIVSSTVKITPLAVIFALLIGWHLFGFAGLIVAVPLAGVVRVILVRLFPEEREVTNAELKPGLTHPPKSEVDPAATDA
jgi:predicted PurR-regulated permease PerM